MFLVALKFLFRKVKKASFMKCFNSDAKHANRLSCCLCVRGNAQ